MTHEENKQQVVEAVSMLMNALNGGRRAEIVEAIYDRVSREHRTLQQSFWSVLLLTQIKYAENDSDLRNEQAVELAKAVKELAVSKNMDYGLSFI